MKFSGWSSYSDSKGYKTLMSKSSPDRMCPRPMTYTGRFRWIPEGTREGTEPRCTVLLLCAGSWAKLRDLQTEDQSLLLCLLFPFFQSCRPSWWSSLWPSRLSPFFPFHVLSSRQVASCASSAMSFLPETRSDGGLLPQMPCASLAGPKAEPQFFLPIFKYQGRNLTGPLWITYQPLDLSFSLCLAQKNDVLGHICISYPPTLT